MQGETPERSGSLRLSLPPEPFGREEAPRAPGYGSLRLQPVMLGPPPEQHAVDVTAEDDIDPAEYGEKPRTGLFAGIVAAIAVMATVGAAYWTLRPVEDTPFTQLPTPQASAPAVLAPLPVPSLAPLEVPAVAASSPAAPIDMGRVDSDLIPPSTEGLTSARRISTIRIQVENDREVIVPR
jgi:hypothetical protein